MIPTTHQVADEILKDLLQSQALWPPPDWPYTKDEALRVIRKVLDDVLMAAETAKLTAEARDET